MRRCFVRVGFTTMGDCMKNKVMNDWLNGRSLRKIARRYGLTVQAAQAIIRNNWDSRVAKGE